MTVDESLAAFAPVLARAGDLGWWRRAYVSTAFGCPYTGRVDAGDGGRRRRPAARARRRRDLLRRHDRRRRARTRSPSSSRWPRRPGVAVERQAFHFHDTRGTALANVAMGLAAGVRDVRQRDRRDRRLPLRARAPPATSRPRTSCTSSTRRAGSTASSLEGVLTAARFIAGVLGKPLATKVGQAGGWDPATGAATGARLSRSPTPRARSGVVERGLRYPPATMDGVVLVLNQNYEPLNVCNLPRAFRLVFGEKAEVIEYDHQMVRTPRTEYRAPSVIRLQYLIRRPRPRVKLSRREVFARDRHTCQYCGRQTHDLTLDHVVPRHRGGGHTWENLVTACKPCNHRKGGKTLEEARLRLHREPPRAAQRPLLAVHAVPRRRAQRRVADVPVPGEELTPEPAARGRGRGRRSRRRPSRRRSRLRSCVS